MTHSLLGHTDTVTSLQLSPDQTTLLSNAHDSTVRTWDVRPFAPVDRGLKTYDGAPTGHERNLLKASWDADGKRIAAGSGDQSVAIWESATGKLLHKLPGHKGAVNDVRFHPQGEPLCKLPVSYLPRDLSRKVFPSQRLFQNWLVHRAKMPIPSGFRIVRSYAPCGGVGQVSTLQSLLAAAYTSYQDGARAWQKQNGFERSFVRVSSPEVAQGRCRRTRHASATCEVGTRGPKGSKCGNACRTRIHRLGMQCESSLFARWRITSTENLDLQSGHGRFLSVCRRACIAC